MATYGRLLISAGGGIIDRGKQSAQESGATVVIGLGGTGTDAVMRLKREVFKQIQPDNLEDTIAKYDNIKYLIIDSDDAKLNNQNGHISDIEPSEYMDISNKAIKATLGNARVMDGRPDMSWMRYRDIAIEDAAAGAGGIRQVGRFLLVDKVQEVYLKIKTVIQSASLGAEGGLNIHICSGISGGTGSGTFLDICYLIRCALNELGKTAANVCGYFFMPDVNLSVPAIAGNPLKSSYVKVNGYAALKELDYCMNFVKNKDSFKMNYGFKFIDMHQRPVDLCYLISSVNSQGKAIKDGYNYAMGVVVDHIISFLAKVEVPKGVAPEATPITLKGHISNLVTIKERIQMQHGAGVDYNILGASVAEMPLSEIATYLGAKLFESFEDIFDKVPTEKEVDNFIMAHQIRYEDIRNTLCKGCVPQMTFPKRYDAKLYKETGNHKFIELGEEFMAQNKGVLETNRKTLLEELKGFDFKVNAVSLINRTFKGLCDKYVAKMEYGPFFAQRLLAGSVGFNLIHKIEGEIVKNQELLDAELYQATRRTEEFQSAQAAMDSANILNADKRMKEYRQSLNNLNVHLYKVHMFQTMNDVLTEYKRQLVKLNDSFFQILTVILNTVRETFDENIKLLTGKTGEANKYNWKILSVSDIKDSLDNEVQKLDLNGVLDHLISGMCENCEKWIGQDEGEVSKLISAFILNEFKDATQKTITTYLREKYNTNDNTALTKHIKDEIIQNGLGNNSTPMFWKNQGYNVVMEEMTTLTVPYDAQEINAAANDYASSQTNITIRRSSIINKISMMRFYSGIPMFAYQGITELQDEYEKDKKYGKHLYERGEIDWNNWIPSPIPYSFGMDSPTSQNAKRNNALIDEFNKAENNGIVYKDNTNKWFIRKTQDFNIGGFIKEQGDYIEGTLINIKKLSDIIIALQEKKKEIYLLDNIETIEIEVGNSSAGNEDKVMLDFYLASPVLNEIVKKELSKLTEIDETLTALENEKEQGNKEGKLKAKFFDAVFTGVISYGKKMVFEYEEFGILKSVELQNAKMEYGDTGAYQAYQTYKELDEKIRKTLDAIAMERKDADDIPEVKTAVENLDSTMKQKISVYMNIYGETHPLHNELEQFYSEFMKAFYSFKALYV